MWLLVRKLGKSSKGSKGKVQGKNIERGEKNQLLETV